MRDERALTERVIRCAIEVHRTLGPGLLESIYEESLCSELEQASITYSRQVALPPVYKNRRLDGECRIDLVVADTAVIEVKAIEQLRPVHDAQLLTYLRLSGLRLGLILNFGSALLKEGIRRLVL
jgi:GxxExxY protein